MSFGPYEIALITGGFTIVGALAGALVGGRIGYNNALSFYKTTEANKASAQFREAFLPEILFLRENIVLDITPSTDQSIFNFMKTAMVHRHARALILYMDTFQKNKAACIGRAWKEYREKTDRLNNSPMTDEEKETALKLLEEFLYNYAHIYIR